MLQLLEGKNDKYLQLLVESIFYLTLLRVSYTTGVAQSSEGKQ